MSNVHKGSPNYFLHETLTPAVPTPAAATTLTEINTEKEVEAACFMTEIGEALTGTETTATEAVHYKDVAVPTFLPGMNEAVLASVHGIISEADGHGE